jgi:large subunit ribosomal protein L9
MEIILKRDIENLGFKDEVVTVKNGYARNFLIPKGYATMATPSAVKVLEENLRQRAKKEEQAINEAKKNADLLAEADVKIKAKTAEGGNKLFGSITSASLADKLNDMGYNVDKKFVSINGGSAKSIGEYEAVIRLHREVTATVNFSVIAE